MSKDVLKSLAGSIFLFFLCSNPVWSCDLLLKNCRQDKTYMLNIMWLSPVINNGACFSSIITDPKQANNCLAWTRRETASPLFDAARNLIYIGGSDGMLHVISANNGSLKQSVPLAEGNLVAKPVMIGNKLFFGTSAGDIIKIDLDTFRVDWKLRVDAEVENQIVLQDSTLFFVTGLSSLYAVNADTGEVQWFQKRPLPSRIFIGVQSNPLLVSLKDKKEKNILICGHPSGRVDYYEASTGKPILNIMVGNLELEFPDVASTPILYQGSVIVSSFNRGIFSLDPSTGEIRWQLAEKEKTRLTAANGLIFAAGNKSVIAIKADDGKIVWRFTFDKGAATDMIVKDGFLYFGSDSNALFVLKINSGQPVRYLGSGLGFAGAFDFSSNQLFAMSTAGYLYAMSPNFKGMVQRANFSTLF